jgi:hypothetical protein
MRIPTGLIFEEGLCCKVLDIKFEGKYVEDQPLRHIGGFVIFFLVGGTEGFAVHPLDQLPKDICFNTG